MNEYYNIYIPFKIIFNFIVIQNSILSDNPYTLSEKFAKIGGDKCKNVYIALIL